MRLRNKSGDQRRIHDVHTGQGITVDAGDAGDFSELCALELLRDLPSEWESLNVNNENEVSNGG